MLHHFRPGRRRHIQFSTLYFLHFQVRHPGEEYSTPFPRRWAGRVQLSLLLTTPGSLHVALCNNNSFFFPRGGGLWWTTAGIRSGHISKVWTYLNMKKRFFIQDQYTVISNNHNIFMSMLALNMRSKHSLSGWVFSRGLFDKVRDKLLLCSFPMTFHTFCKRTRLLIFSFRKHRSQSDGDNTGEL